MIKDNSCEVIELTRRRNALLPISQLPDWVLVEVFYWYRELHSGSKAWVNIIRITHVCHAWRVIASSHGRLWTSVYAVCGDLVEHWLERSANCPLDVMAYRSGGKDLRQREFDAVCLALEALPRIRTLSISNIRFTNERLSTSRWLHSPATILRSLIIRAGAGTYTEYLDDSFCLTEVMLGRDLPSLDRLVIDDDRFLSNTARFPPSLKHLIISNMVPSAAWDPHMVSVILTVLETLPSLESLHLTWCYDESDRIAVPAIGHQVILPRLQKLKLIAGGQPHLFAYLWRHITFPSAVKVDLEVAYYDDLERTVMEDVGAKWSGHGLIGESHPLRSLFIGCHEFDHDQIIIEGWAAAQPPEFHSCGSSDIRIVLSGDGDGGCPDIGEFVCMSCDTLPLSKVESLGLYKICLELRPETFITISQNMPALHTLYIRNWSTRDAWLLCQCLFSKASAGVDGLFPNLINLHLECLWGYNDTIGFWEFLEQFLARRMERGSSIRKLILMACDDVDAGYRKRLEGVVGQLIWNPMVYNCW